MTEARIAATERLRKAGRWAEAALFKDAEIKRLRAQGRTRSEASESAWAKMLSKFPPLPQDPGLAPSEPAGAATCDPDKLDELAAVPLDWERDVRWVDGHLEHPAVRVENASSLDAWGLLRHASQDRSRFFPQCGSVLARSLPQPQPPCSDRESADINPYKSDPGLRDLERMIERMQS